jgi:hypothetical protein
MTMSPNITNDPDTGIGRWTEEQIITTIRTMVRPDGKPIEGPMALYADAWAKLTPADARALAAYVRSIPGVRNDVPDRRQAVAP